MFVFGFTFANQRQQDEGTAQTPAGLLLRVWDNVGHNVGVGEGLATIFWILEIFCELGIWGFGGIFQSICKL